MKPSRMAFGFLLLSAAVAAGQQYVISTYAGGVPPQTPAPGVNLSIEGGGNLGVAADAAGNAYFTSFHCVFKLDRDGMVTRIAGTSRPGYSGDGGPAASAQLRLVEEFSFGLSGAPLPAALAVDHAGNVFIADNGNHRIRRVSADGIITTVAGNGTQGFSGDDGPATSAQLSSLPGMAADDAGNLFIADAGNHRVRQVSPDGIISTVAGNGTPGRSGDGGAATSAQLWYPAGVAVDGSGNLLIADTENGRIRMISPDGIITTVAGSGKCCASSGDGGPATLAALYEPTSVAADRAGNLFIADTKVDEDIGDFVQVVRKVSAGGTITTVAGTGVKCNWNIYNGDCDFTLGDGGPAARGTLHGALGLAVDGAGNLFIADTWNNRVRKASADGIITTVAGGAAAPLSGDARPATGANLFHPSAVAVDGAGNLFITDTYTHRIRKVSTDGTITTVAGNGTPGRSGDGGAAAGAQLWYPLGVAADGAGNVFFDDATWRVRKVSPDGIITTVAGNGTQGFSGDGGPAIDAKLADGLLTVDGVGNLFFQDYNGHIRKVSADGIIHTVANTACCPAADLAGNLFVGSRAGVLKVSTDGTVTTVAGGDVGAIAVDGAGNLFIADFAGSRIRKVSPDGVITTVAGNGTLGYSGDGGPASDAQLRVSAMAVDGAGNVYIADWFNNAVRILRPMGAASQ